MRSPRSPFRPAPTRSKMASSCSSTQMRPVSIARATTGSSPCAPRASPTRRRHRSAPARRHRLPPRAACRDHLGAAGKVQSIEDCRATINPLTAIRGCCTARWATASPALASSPPSRRPSTACPPKAAKSASLPAAISKPSRISGRVNVSIHGCGHRTRLASPSFGSGKVPNTGAVIQIVSSQDIQLHSFVVEAALGDIGIELNGTTARFSTARPARRRADVHRRDHARPKKIVVGSNQPAVSVEQAHDVRSGRIAHRGAECAVQCGLGIRLRARDSRHRATGWDR